MSTNNEFKFSRWSAWWIVVAAAGSAIEAKSLKSEDTNAPLCAHVRWTFSMGDSHGKAANTRRIVGVSLWAWFLYHVAVPNSRKPRPFELIRKALVR